MYALALSTALNTSASTDVYPFHPSVSTYFYVFVCFMYIVFDFVWFHEAAREIEAPSSDAETLSEEESSSDAETLSEEESSSDAETETDTETLAEEELSSDAETKVNMKSEVVSPLQNALELLTIAQLKRITTKADLREIVLAKNKQRYIYAATRTIVRKILSRRIQPEDVLDALSSMTVPQTAVNILRHNKERFLAELQFLMSFQTVAPASVVGTQ